MAFKTYKEDVTAAAVKEQLSRVARDLDAALVAGQRKNEEWEAFKQGKTPTQIETQLGITSAELTDINQAFNALRDLSDATDGDNTVVIPTGTNTWFRRLREFG